MSARLVVPLSILSLVLVSCDVMRAQKRASAEPQVDVTAMGAMTAKTSADDPPAEKRFQNIQVLKGLPSSQLYPVMSLMANSLGVTCAHCHTEYFEEESRPEKQVARQMVLLTRAINRAQFQSEPTVTCYTCHHGSEYPPSVPDLDHAGWQSMLSSKEAPEPLPEVDAVLARYVPARIAGRGEITVVGGLNERKSGTFELTDAAIQSDVKLPPPLEKALQRFGAIDIRKTYDELSVIQRKTLDGKPALVVAAESGDGPPDRFSFDAETGALLRFQTGTPTELGYVPEELRFSPGTVQWARGDYLVTLRFSETR